MLVLRFLRRKLAQAISEGRGVDADMHRRRIRAIEHGGEPD